MNGILFWIKRTAFTILVSAVHFALAVIYWKKEKVVPPIKNKLLLKSATILAQDIREGKLKSEDIIRAYIDRILEVEPYINAVAHERFQDALEEAKEVDSLIQSGKFSKDKLEVEKPLLGVPFTVKMILAVKGLPHTGGCKLFENRFAEEDAPSVSLLRKAGGILLATTNIPEFSISFETNNVIHGKTCNPYNTSRTSGGSSGGESALLAAGASVIGLGNDLGGSIRLPAHFTGIFGHKPTKNLTDSSGTFPPAAPENLQILSTGPLCRYSEDLSLIMNILTAQNKEKVLTSEKVDFKKLKVFYTTDFGDPKCLPLTKETEKAILKAAFHLADKYGATVKEINLHMEDITVMGLTLLHASDENSREHLTPGHVQRNEHLKELFRLFKGRSTFSLGGLLVFCLMNKPFYIESKVPYYRDNLKKMITFFDTLFEDNTILLSPTFPVSAPYHYEMTFLLLSLSTCYTFLWNYIGNPATVVPVGLDRNKMPHGLQIIGKRNNDGLLLACADELSKVFGGWVPPE